MAADDLIGDSEAARAAMRARLWPTFVAIVVMAGTMAFVAFEFTGVVAAWPLRAWVGYMLAVDAGLLASILLFALPASPIRWPLARWVRFSRVFSVGFSLGVVAGVWILLPPAGPELRMLAVLLFVWFVAMMMMSSGTLTNMLGCVALLASLFAFVVTSDIAYRVELAVLLASIGAALVGIRRAIWRAADDATAARDLSERAAVVLERGLAIAAAQRDAKTRFIAAASHDLQQPLMAARLFVDQIEALPPGSARARAVAGAAHAIASSQGVIGQMLDFLRLEANAEVARPQPVALGALLRDLAAEQAAVAVAAGLRLRVVGEATALADPAMLRRAIGNLVANAIKHSGGTRMLLVARRRATTAELLSLDDGCGIAAGERATLFDDFSQGVDAAPGGFGLGLASARRLVTAMDGTLAFESRWMAGAAFRIVLPLAAAQSAEVPLCAAA